MIPHLRNVTLALSVALMATGLGTAQQTTSYTNRRGDTVTDTHSLQNGQYTNDKTVTAPNGNTRTNDFTASRNSNGRLVTSDTRTGPNGRSATETTTHGRYGNRTTVTGPNGHSRTYRRRR
jgi:hypothetical protein